VHIVFVLMVFIVIRMYIIMNFTIECLGLKKNKKYDNKYYKIDELMVIMFIKICLMIIILLTFATIVILCNWLGRD